MSLSANTLILIQSDPRKTHRPCEGIRIALGLASSGHQVDVLLTKKGTLLLETEVHDYVDAENLEKFLFALTEVIPYFLIDKPSSLKNDQSDTPYEKKILSKEDVASKTSSADVFLTF